MKLRSLRSTDIECFSGTTEFPFSDRFTLVIGTEGSGKSALLRMAAASLGAFVSALGVPAPGILASQIRRTPAAGEASAPVFPCSIAATATLAGHTLEWQRTVVESFGRPLHRDDLTQLKELTGKILFGIAHGEPVDLPLFASYSMPRLKPSTPGAPDETQPRLAGYRGCLESSLEVDAPAALAALVAEAAEGSGTDTTFDAVTAALSAFLDCEIALEQQEGELMLGLEMEPLLPWDAHPASMRRNVALVADLVRRGGLLNPHMGAMVPALIEGVVLIDSPESDLHPRWARKWVEDMQGLFPKLQFIGATNSPFLIQSLHDGDVLDLNHRPTANRHSDLSIEDIVEEYQGVEMPQRSKRFHDMNRAAEQVMKLVRDGKNVDPARKKALKAKLDALMKPYSNEPAFHAVLKFERIAAGLESDSDDAFPQEEDEE